MTAVAEMRGRHASRAPRTMRGIGLFGRVRNLPAFAVGVVVVALLAWWAAEWLSSRPESSGATDRGPVVALAPLTLAILVSTTLFAADEELERTGAWPWRRVRLGQVACLTVVGAAAVAVTGLEEPTVYGAVELVRNCLACVGMVAVAAPVVGGRLAWSPAFVYVVAVHMAAPRPVLPDTGWWTWPVQLSGSTPAWWACLTWYVVGVAAYARWGSRPRRSDDT